MVVAACAVGGRYWRLVSLVEGRIYACRCRQCTVEGRKKGRIGYRPSGRGEGPKGKHRGLHQRPRLGDAHLHCGSEEPRGRPVDERELQRRRHRAEGRSAGGNRPPPLPGGAGTGRGANWPRPGHCSPTPRGSRAVTRNCWRKTPFPSSNWPRRRRWWRRTRAWSRTTRGQIDAAKLNLVLPHHGAHHRRVGLRLVDPGNIVHAADTTGMLVITQIQPISVDLHRGRG
jgi:hypothetical protein